MSESILELRVPSVGESVTEVEIAEWLKKEGDLVRLDESVLVLETDKATVEVPSPVAGRLLKVMKQKGDRVQVGEVLGAIEAGEFAAPANSPVAKVPPATRPVISEVEATATDVGRGVPSPGGDPITGDASKNPTSAAKADSVPTAAGSANLGSPLAVEPLATAQAQ